MPPLFCNTILLSTFIHKNKYGSVRKGNFPEENNRPLQIHELLFQNVKSFLSLPTHLDRVYLCVSTMRLCYRVSRRRLVEFWHASSSCNQLIRKPVPLWAARYVCYHYQMAKVSLFSMRSLTWVCLVLCCAPLRVYGWTRFRRIFHFILSLSFLAVVARRRSVDEYWIGSHRTIFYAPPNKIQGRP